MNIKGLDAAQAQVAKLWTRGVGKAANIRRTRERARLFGELGEYCYEHRTGVCDRESDIARVVSLIADRAEASDDPEQDKAAADD